MRIWRNPVAFSRSEPLQNRWSHLRRAFDALEDNFREIQKWTNAHALFHHRGAMLRKLITEMRDIDAQLVRVEGALERERDRLYGGSSRGQRYERWMENTVWAHKRARREQLRLFAGQVPRPQHRAIVAGAAQRARLRRTKASSAR